MIMFVRKDVYKRQPLTIKEWKQKYLDKNSKFKTLHIFVSAVGASLRCV